MFIKTPKLLGYMHLSILLSIGTINHAQAAIFEDYNATASGFRENMALPLSDHSQQIFEKKIKSNDAVLYLLERARLQQASQQYAESRDSFKQAFELIDQANGKAKISLSKIGFKALSLVSNDGAVPYKIPNYELVFAHVYQSVNYLALGESESAGVEMRIAQSIQREIENAHAKEEQKAVEKNTNAQDQSQNNLDESIAGLNTIAAKVKNTYQNAYSFYMAATLWEALGERNDALVDFKKAYELQPEAFIQSDVKRLDQSLVKNDQYPVVVLLEQGLVPQKVSTQFAIPTTNGLANISYASYNPKTYVQPIPVTISINNVQKATTSTLTDIGALAVKTLKDNLKSTLATQITRTTAKYALQKELGNQLGIFGQLAGNIYNTATEKADLRSWNTLPSNAQVARFTLPAGKYTLDLKNNTAHKSIVIEVKPDQTTFVHGINTNQQMLANSFLVSHP